jgi:formylglycine-generating enzyme required for sulfatase activity
MVWVRGGHFRMGSDSHHPEEAPARTVSVDGFWIDAAPVTNRQFQRFVNATGWVTTAERAADPAQYPGASPALLAPASAVFRSSGGHGQDEIGADGWAWTSGADWRHPLGPESSLIGLDDHPVVHMSWEDVSAYSAWVRTDLPTEAEWEYAARGGLDDDFAWGEELNRLRAGWTRTSPVKSHPTNPYGLYDMIGNVWEWTRDWWSTRSGAVSNVKCCSVRNRVGGGYTLSDDPALAHLKIPRRVIKGGSNLCASGDCGRYRPAARQPMSVDASASHLGFRCVIRPSMMR